MNEVKPSLISKLGYKLLEELENNHRKGEKLNEEQLTELCSVFGPVAMQAAHLLDKFILIEYRTKDEQRKIYKIGNRRDHLFTIYSDINYCQCDQFRVDILQKKDCFMCEHVLAFKLNDILAIKAPKVETISDSQFVDFLNEQFNLV